MVVRPIYFAHPVNVYNTPLEKAVEAYLSFSYPGDIENPNQQHHQAGYKAWQERTAKNRDQHKGMSYFFDEILPKCRIGCVAMPFLDGHFGLGVAGEAKWFLERGKKVLVIGPTWAHTTSQYLQEFIENPQCGCFTLRQMSKKESDAILNNDPTLVVPHQETRLRTWIVYNKQMRPYETAHLVSMPIPPGFYPEDSKK